MWEFLALSFFGMVLAIAMEMAMTMLEERTRR
jgi:hypothetical protein